MLWTSLLPAAVIVAAIFWFIRWLAYGRFSLRTPADGWILLLTLTIPLTLFVTIVPEKTIPQALRLLSGIAFYYAVVNWAGSTKQLQIIAYALIMAGFLLALSAPLSVQWSIGKLPFIPTDIYQRFALFVMDTIHPNVMGGVLALLLPLSVAYLLFNWSAYHLAMRSLLAIATTGMLAALILSQSRSAWLAVGAALLLILYLRRWWAALGLFLIFCIIAGFITYRVGTEVVLDLFFTSQTIDGISGRQEIWRRGIYMIQDFPITGIGMGSFSEMAALLYPFYLVEQTYPLHAHNLFLQVGVDLGIPGLIAWLAVFLTIVVSCIQLFRFERGQGDGQILSISAGLLASQLALGINGLTDAVTWGMVRPAPLVWVLWGLCAASCYVFLPKYGIKEPDPIPID